ncbi:MAG: heme exporter protein CcmD [Alphaproteobacteria bacterium]|nr:heme exporter protein CcmD [Alphaproteobacteria bacterium]MBU4135708.1 heme exporter protein CcmD [Alphaproteobacteria bacterium]
MFDPDMGRYAAFVWPAWALSAVVLAGLSARALVAARRWSAELKRLEDEPNRAQAVQSTVAPRK